MDKLIEYGINEEEYTEMIEKCYEIKELSDKEIIEKINILEYLNCNVSIIRNIIISNPTYLTRDINDIKGLINKLLSFGIQRIDITFDSNPWLLNYDAFEIDDFIAEKKNEGLNMDDIIDLIDAGVIE